MGARSSFEFFFSEIHRFYEEKKNGNNKKETAIKAYEYIHVHMYMWTKIDWQLSHDHLLNEVFFLFLKIFNNFFLFKECPACVPDNSDYNAQQTCFIGIHSFPFLLFAGLFETPFEFFI